MHDAPRNARALAVLAALLAAGCAVAVRHLDHHPVDLAVIAAVCWAALVHLGATRLPGGALLPCAVALAGLLLELLRASLLLVSCLLSGLLAALDQLNPALPASSSGGTR